MEYDPLERLVHGDADGDQAWEELRNLLGSRIDKALAGQVSGKSIEEVLADELAEGALNSSSGSDVAPPPGSGCWRVPCHTLGGLASTGPRAHSVLVGLRAGTNR